MKAALLIGNGINRCHQKASDSWDALLAKLAIENGCALKSKHQVSQLPLEFERIYFHAHRQYNQQTPPPDSESNIKYQLKTRLQQRMPRLEDFALLQKFTGLSVEHILTTNYDYNIEKALNPAFSRKKYARKPKETKYSINRRFQVTADKTVWHIHGEAETPNSICLGYEHYCGQLAAMHGRLLKPLNENEWEEDEKKSNSPYWKHYLNNQGGPIRTWLTMFFTHDIYIVGLGLSFMEIDLWWLLNQWGQKRLEQLKNSRSINNKIHYFYGIDAKQTVEDSLREPLRYTRAMGVETHPVAVRNDQWASHYERIYKKIAKMLARAAATTNDANCDDTP